MSPDHRQHRGAHPEDGRLFAVDRIPALRAATADLSWLLTHGYALTSSLKLVGDRHGLTERQRVAIARAACGDAERDRRQAICLDLAHLRGADLIIDGFNLTITIEAALGGGVVLLCRDGCVRDLSSLRRSISGIAMRKRVHRRRWISGLTT